MTLHWVRIIQILRYIDIDRIKIDRSYTSKLDNKLDKF